MLYLIFSVASSLVCFALHLNHMSFDLRKKNYKQLCYMSSLCLWIGCLLSHLWLASGENTSKICLCAIAPCVQHCYNFFFFFIVTSSNLPLINLDGWDSPRFFRNVLERTPMSPKADRCSDACDSSVAVQGMPRGQICIDHVHHVFALRFKFPEIRLFDSKKN